MIPKPPRWMLYTGVLAGLALAIPPVVIARVRSTPDPNRGVHIFFDMDFQPKFKPQAENPLFADGRAQRYEVLGTVARGETKLDAHRYEGVVDGKWADTLPAGMELTEEFLKRGQQRYNIYCSVCHGYAGFGDGSVNKRAMELMSNTEGPVQGTAWVQAKSLHDPLVREHSVGLLYNIVTNGIRNMAGYGAQIDLEDRWAIAAYVQALQFSQNATIQDVPPELREKLPKNVAQTEGAASGGTTTAAADTTEVK
ncbi:MAG: c-type cytochrome [bacterium]|jgi:mono/diheme cytochrome c family protein